MRCVISLILQILMAVSGGRAQDTPVRPLIPGDRMPDIVFANVMNGPAALKRVSDLEGDLLILDFWSTWCSACIAAFPTMDSLKQTFGSRVDVLLINTKSAQLGDSPEKIKKLISRVATRTGRAITLPIIYGDDLLDRLFPNITIPHEVWISKGKVVAITGAEEVTADNIREVLHNGAIDLPLKQDAFGFADSVPLFIGGNGGNAERVEFRSLLTGYAPLARGGIRYRMKTTNDSTRQVVGYSAVNMPALSLLRQAFSMLFTFPDNRVLIDSSITYITSWKHKDLYCYDLIVPPSTPAEVDNYIREDIRRYFRITVSNQRRTRECWILSGGDRKTKATRVAKPDFDLLPDSKRKYLSAMDIHEAVVLLNRYLHVPVLDECAPNNITVNLPNELSDFEQMKIAFGKAGYTLRRETRSLEMTVISPE